MISNKYNLVGCSVVKHANYPTLILGIPVAIASSVLTVVNDSAQARESTADAEGRIHTSAAYLLTPQSVTSAAEEPAATLAPEKDANKPAFSASQAVPTVSPASFRSNPLPMQAPTPPPPSIVSQAPAPVPYLEDTAVPAPETVIPSIVPTEAADQAIPEVDSVFIDPTDYSLGATQADSPALVFSERSTGCQVTVAGGEMNQSCGAPAVAEDPRSSGMQIGPVSVGSQGVSVGNFTVVSRDFLNQKLRPLNVLRRGTEEYVFPLSIPAPITSLFGWRVHPIYGDHRFHSGTDLAAPMGSPVLATQAGRVAIADHIGGYGLTVILRHGEGDIETRYAHLSQIAVSPGEWIEQGEVIGLVGSTGNSTGPHLHFEVRQLTAQGWVAMDAREVLQNGMANLIEVLNNPLQAMGQAAEDDVAPKLPGDYPYRPAQPNAS